MNELYESDILEKNFHKYIFTSYLWSGSAHGSLIILHEFPIPILQYELVTPCSNNTSVFMLWVYEKN